jgi:chromosome segregation ATPase
MTRGKMDDPFYKEVSESLKLVFDLTSRIDERMKILIESNNDYKEKIEKLSVQHGEAIMRISILENKASSKELDSVKVEADLEKVEEKMIHLTDRMSDVEKDIKSHSNKWSSMVDFIFKVGVIVIGGIILWKLGLK